MLFFFDDDVAKLVLEGFKDVEEFPLIIDSFLVDLFVKIDRDYWGIRKSAKDPSDGDASSKQPDGLYLIRTFLLPVLIAWKKERCGLFVTIVKVVMSELVIIRIWNKPFLINSTLQLFGPEGLEIFALGGVI